MRVWMINKIALSAIISFSGFFSSVALARQYVPTHMYTCQEIADAINANGYVDVVSYGESNVRFYSEEIMTGEQANACDEANGKWRRYDVIDSNEQRCSPGVACIEKFTKRRRGGHFSCNGTFHSGSREGSSWCPPKKK